MKILLLADPNSSHTQKWAISLAQKGFAIGIFGLSTYNGNLYNAYTNIQVYGFGLSKEQIGTKDTTGKMRYVQAVPMLKKIIKEYKPDIVHAHYATSYGLLGVLSGFHPLFISVWGSDIYEFPKKSFLHKKLLEFNLTRADRIFSTSHAMAEETKKYTTKEIHVIPFGIDLNIFKPDITNKNDLFLEDDLVIGTVKSLEEIYGIEYLIEAFKILKDRQPLLPLKLLIVGGGSQEGNLKQKVKDMNLENQTVFTGKVEHKLIVKYHNMISVFVALSISESFGVSIIEAGACGKPVVVSNVEGLPEVVEKGITGFIVEPKNPLEATNAIEKLLLEPDLRVQMGKNARKRVEHLYKWDDNIKQMMEMYKNVER